MTPFSLNELCAIARGTLFPASSGNTSGITGITAELSRVGSGVLFCCMHREKNQAQQDMIVARLKGAAAVLGEVAPYNHKIPYICVPDALSAFQALAGAYRARLRTKIIGITGSVGKTTTKEMLASALSRKYRTYKTPENMNGQTGVPCCLTSIREDDEYAVLEMGISLPGEMERLSRIVRPDICVILNIQDAHLEGLQTGENILREKSMIYSYLPPDGKVFLNGEDGLLRTIRRAGGIQPCFFTRGDYSGLLPFPGEHFRLNAAAAAAVAADLGLSDEEIAEGIAATQAVQNRCFVEKVGSLTIINDFYNANPASVKAALDLLCSMPSPRTGILGDMLELGERTEELHREIGTYAASKDIDKLVFIGSLSQNSLLAAKEAAREKEMYYFTNVEEFRKSAQILTRTGETILIKASRSMAFENVRSIFPAKTDAVSEPSR